MKRRDFIRLGSLLILLPSTTRILAGCGGGDSDNTGGDEEGVGVQTFTFTSSLEGGHTHTLALTASELANPPPGGLNRETSVDFEHLHTVELTEAELASISAGDAVMKTTSRVAGHAHSFEFRMS
jgi:hypothetical protein